MTSTIIGTRKNLIIPLNSPQNGEWSFKNGASLIQLSLASSPVALITDSVKLNFKLRMNQSTSTFSTPVLCDNLNNRGSSGAFQMLLDERVGCAALIDVITWSSGKTNATLESIRSYGRLLATD